MSIILPEYKDYRRFIRDYITKQKEMSSKYSMIYYSKRIETSDSYIKLVVSGKRSLSIDKAALLAKAFDLSPAEKAYFITLVMENDTHEVSAKSYFKGLLVEKAQSNFSYTKNRKLTSIFEDRLSWEIFSLMGLHDFQNTPNYIKKKLSMNATEGEIVNTLQRLLKIGAVREERSGRMQTENIVIPHKFNPAKAYATALSRALKHINTGISDSSYFDSFCLILDRDQYDQIREILEEAKGKIAKIAAKRDRPKTHIAYLNLNLFPASK